MKRSMFRRALAMIVAAALLSVILPRPAVAGPSARLQGRVLESDGVTPMSGVIVNLLDTRNQVNFPSVPTNERGVFEATAPVGSYRIVAETKRGAYLASGPLKLREGKNPPLSLKLKQADAEGTEPTPQSPPDRRKGALAPWAKWTIVGGIVVAGLVVINSVAKNETTASGF